PGRAPGDRAPRPAPAARGPGARSPPRRARSAPPHPAPPRRRFRRRGPTGGYAAPARAFAPRASGHGSPARPWWRRSRPSGRGTPPPRRPPPPAGPPASVRTRPGEELAHPRQQLARVEGLHHVVVGSPFQPGHDVLLPVLQGEEDDRDARVPDVPPQRPQQV